MKWSLYATLPDGHRLFGTLDNERSYALADESGRTPDQTDDGVLWLDTARPLLASADWSLIPLTDEDGNECYTLTDTPSLLRLSRDFTWAIETHPEDVTVRNTRYHVASS